MSKFNNQTAILPKESNGILFGDVDFYRLSPVRNCHKKDIYIYLYLYLYLYIGHLFVKHDLALICVDTRGRKKQRKSGRERIKEDLFLPHRGVSTHMNVHISARTRRPTHTYTHASAHRHTHTWLLLWPLETVCTSAAEGFFWKSGWWVGCGAMKLTAPLFVPREITFILDSD